MFINFFYDATAKAYMNELMVQNTNLLSNVTLYILDKTAMGMLEPAYDIDFIKTEAIASVKLTGTKVWQTPTDIIFGADDVELDLVGMSLADIDGFVFATPTQPLFEIEGKHLTRIDAFINNKLIVKFSNGYDKIIRISKDEYDTDYSYGETIIMAPKEAQYEIQKPTDIIRSGILVTPQEDRDKKSDIGKNAIYKDLSITGRPHPLTGDIVTVTGNAAIAQSIKNILLANTYDRPFSSQNIAGNINAMLFEFNDDIMVDELKTVIAIAITNHEPRVTLMGVDVKPIPEKYSVEVAIVYSIKSTNQQQSLTLILDRA